MSDNASPAELAKFGALAAEWWDPDGPMRALHHINPVRVAWITARLRPLAALQPGPLRLLDVGCGAGIAAEALARRGFTVTGIDAAPELVQAARTRGGATYRVARAETLAAEGATFDAVTALEVIEHIPDQAAFVVALAALIRPGGVLVISTLNRTWRSLLGAKLGAEYVIGLLPRGTHDWSAFVPPAQLAEMARAAGLRPTDLVGLNYNPATGRARLSPDTSSDYLFAAGRDMNGS